MPAPTPTGPNPHAPNLPYFATKPFGVDYFSRAAVKYTSHATLRCSPETLFEIFEDEKSWTRWALGIVDVEWTSPKPFGVGTTRTVRFAGGMEVYEEFIAWQTGREMAFTFTGITQPIWDCFGEHYLVEDRGDGTCRLTWTVAYEPRDTFARIHALVKPAFTLGFKLYMKRLEQVAAAWTPKRTATSSARVASGSPASRA